MILHSTTVIELLEGKTQYNVPIYQRNYDWTIEQASKLLEDIKNVSELKYPKHHFGVMYYFEDRVAPGDIKRCNIVDGQQRITTISILFKSILDHISENNICLDLVDDIKGYLTSKHKGIPFNKLVLKKGDNDVFTLLIGGEIKKIESKTEYRESNIYKNYKHFKDALNKLSEEEVNEIFNNISALEISSHLCEKEKDDPQTIFQNINSSGKPLTQTNLIMNYSLQYMEESDMIYSYENYWLPIERIINDEKDIEDFVRNFITILTFSNPKKGKIYDEYKKVKGDQIDIIKSLHKYATFYENIYRGAEPNRKIKNLFEEGLKITSYVESFLLYLYNDYDSRVISETDFIEILNILKNYIIRRNVYFSKSRDLTPVFCDLMGLLNICKKETPEKYIEEIKAYFLLLKKDDSKIPNDIEVSRALLESKDFYKGPYCKLILLSLERNNSKEYIDANSLSIEHILPQNPLIPQVWKDELGYDYKDIKERKCHNIGNLTLTGYNSEYSDKSFNDKKSMNNGLNDSPIKLNRYFKEIDKWNEDAIVMRSEHLSNLFNVVYPYLTLDDNVLEVYKNREVERIDQYEVHKDIYLYLIEKLNLNNSRKNVFSNKVLFENENYQIKFNKKSINISESDDDDNKTTIKEKSDVDRYLLNRN
jgi:uncharacterized protein with ParB-like and HNH nuclease domain